MAEFHTPPINEVVISQSFVARQDFLVPHFGEYWSRIKSAYPKVQHAAPILAPDEMPIPDMSGAFLPRVWFISSDNTRLLQLQQNRLAANWRQTDKNEEYVRFPQVLNAFTEAWSNFEAYVEESLESRPIPTRTEITYVNVIRPHSGEDFADMCSRVLVDPLWATHSRYLQKPEKLQLQLEIPMANNLGILLVRTGTAHSNLDGQAVLRLELTASGTPAEELGRERWLQEAHDQIINAFEDLTTEDSQVRDWGRKS